MQLGFSVRLLGFMPWKELFEARPVDLIELADEDRACGIVVPFPDHPPRFFKVARICNLDLINMLVIKIVEIVIAHADLEDVDQGESLVPDGILDQALEMFNPGWVSPGHEGQIHSPFKIGPRLCFLARRGPIFVKPFAA